MNPRKGITPIISTVLLLAISVFATLTAYGVINETQDQAAGSIETQLQEQEMEQRSEFTFQQVFEGSDGHTLIDVRNTGGVSLALKKDGSKTYSMYVDGQPIDGDGKTYKLMDQTSDDVVLDPQETQRINTTEPFPQQGESTHFRMVGPYNTRDTHVCANTGSDWC